MIVIGSKVIEAGKSISLCFIKDFIIKFKSKNKYFFGHFDHDNLMITITTIKSFQKSLS